MVTDIPKPKITDNLFDYVEFFDKAYDTHLALALGTDQRVHLIDDKPCSDETLWKTSRSG